MYLRGISVIIKGRAMGFEQHWTNFSSQIRWQKRDLPIVSRFQVKIYQMSSRDQEQIL